LPLFFELAFTIKNIHAFLQNEKIQKFLAHDLKFIVQSVQMVDNLTDFVKFCTYFKLDNDPELYELLADQVKKRMGEFQVEEMLQILVNLSHSLTPEA